MRSEQKKWAVLLKVIRVAGGKSQEEIANGFHRDQAFASRVESNKTVISPDVITDWIGLCGGKHLIDSLIRHLKSLRGFLDAQDVEYGLLQA